MSKPIAIVSTLWPSFQGALAPFLRRKPGCTIFTLAAHATLELQAICARHEAQLLLLDQFLDEADRNAVMQRDAALQQTLRDHLSTNGFADFSRRYNDSEQSLNTLLLQAGSGQFLSLSTLLFALDRAQHHFDLQLMVLSEDVTGTGKLMAAWARHNKVPSLHVLHAIALARPFTVHNQLVADYAAVYGQRGIESFLDLGISPERLRITGNPAWDGYAGLSEAQRSEARLRLAQRHGLNPQLPIVVFGPTWAHNLSAVSDEKVFGRSLFAFLQAVAEMRAAGIPLQAVIKDRPSNQDFARSRLEELYAAAGLSPDSVPYIAEAARDWMLGADIIVAQDSNLLVEALICGTPAVNVLTDVGLRLGPSFDAESGILEATPETLSLSLAGLLSDPALRERCRQEMLAAAPRYNAGNDGLAGERLAELMLQLCRSSATPYVWKECLDVPDIDATGYHGGARGDLVDFFTNDPKLLIDIGCAAGGTGALFKERYPEAKVLGFELNRSAAQIASQRLDRVLVGKFEDYDLGAQGIALGSVDAVILADVLEHMYNPWQVMEKLRPYLSPRAQVVVSIPNVRNLALMDDLARGYFRYERLGLLDITHIRFFTYKELLRFFHETGYHVVRNNFGIDSRLRGVLERHQNLCPCDIDTGKVVLKNVSLEELYELCSLQFFMVVEPGQEQLVGYETPGQFQQGPAQVYAKLLADHQITHSEAQLYDQQLDSHYRPRVHLALAVDAARLPLLPATIKSLADQLYDRVRVSIVSPLPAPAEFTAGERMEWVQVAELNHAALNPLFAGSDADWFGILNAGDMLVPHSLLLMLETARLDPARQLIYGDEDRFQPAEGSLDQPFFKPDFNLAYLRSLPYLGDFYLLGRQAFAQLRGYRAEAAGMADYDLQLRTHELLGRAAFCHVADVLYHRSSERSLGNQATQSLVEIGQQVLAGHLARSGSSNLAHPGQIAGSYRLESAADAPQPGVSILMLARNNLPQLQRSLEQLLNQTQQSGVELLLLDCLSDDGATPAWLDALDQLGNPQLRIFAADQLEGGYYRLANLLAGQARGEVLLFLAPDAVPLNAQWLPALLAQLAEPDVVAVGGKLFNAKGEIISAGRILGLGGQAESLGRGQRLEDSGYFGRLLCAQELSALDIACLALRRAEFERQGGFNEDYQYLFGDVDLCLRLGSADGRLVWTPDAQLLHEDIDFIDLAGLNGEARKSAYTADRDRLYRSWLPQLANDPAFNRNLSLATPECVIETRAELTRLRLPWQPLPRLLAVPMDDAGCGNYRVIQPFNQALRNNVVEGWCRFGTFNPVEIARIAPDTLYVQRHVLSQHQSALADYRRHFPAARIVFEVDDLMAAVPEKSLHRANIPTNVGDLLAQAVQYCDRLVVTTEPLREAYAGLIPDIRVVPNSIDLEIWGKLEPRRRGGQKPRVGWAGGSSHTGDLEILIPVVEALKDEVEWVFFGMFPTGCRESIAEYHGGVPIAEYPAKLAGLDLDLALVPLELNAFNECKSNLRLLEYGVLGYPVIATDFTPYQCDLPVTLVDNQPESWIAAIRAQLADRPALAARGDALREAVKRDWCLEKMLPLWRSAWFDF